MWYNAIQFFVERRLLMSTRTYVIIVAGLMAVYSICLLPVAVAQNDAPENKPVIIDHNCLDVTDIPDQVIEKAAQQRVLLRHASVGMGINWGLDCLAGKRANQQPCAEYKDSIYDRSNWKLESRGNPGAKKKVDDLADQAKKRHGQFDVLMMKFCYIDALRNNHPRWPYYRNTMEKLQGEYPDTTFVFWTIPLTRDGQPGTDLFNEKVRSYCRENGKVLFDIADIEAYDPNGVKQFNDNGDEVISAKYTKEIHAGHLNTPGRIRVAQAFWYLNARLTGWKPKADNK